MKVHRFAGLALVGLAALAVLTLGLRGTTVAGAPAVAPLPATGLELLARPEATPATMGPAVDVDSRAADETYPVWLWTPSVSGTTVGQIEQGAMSDGVLTLSGWAGDVSLGLRMADVLVVACDHVIASVAVDGQRDDIAARHPNLIDTGWEARIALADLPDCADRSLHAYGIAYYSDTAFPLSGEVAMPATRPSTAPRLHRAERPLRDPAPIAAPVRTVQVGGSGLVLRRCGAQRCDVVGRLPAGRQSLLVLDVQAGWLLVAKAGSAAGWAPSSILGVTN